MKLTRRGSLLATAGLLLPWQASAMGRKSLGGRLRFRWPYATATLDPHDLFDPLAACMGSAIADTVFAKDGRGRIYPALAAAMPRVGAGEVMVRLRAGLRSAHGRPLDAGDLLASLRRARRRGAAAFMARLPGLRFSRVGGDSLSLRCGKVDASILVDLLSSPLCALLPRGFDPRRPDGTGAFKATLSDDVLELERNPFAARGPSYLRSIHMASSSDITESLRAFEMKEDDLGWLGLGLHRDRRDAQPFDHGDVGWVLLCTGDEAGSLALPGIAQQLANAVKVESLHLGLRPRAGLSAGVAWLGDPAPLLYDQGSAHLRVIAERVAAQLSRPGHEIRAKGISRARWRVMRKKRNYVLALDFVRDPMLGAWAHRAALATADRLGLAKEIVTRSPARGAARPAHRLTANLRVGVLGALSARGGVAPTWHLPPRLAGGGTDWSNAYRL